MKMRLISAAIPFAMATLLAATAAAHDFKAANLRVDHPWARATTNIAKTGAAYLSVLNDGAEVDRLLAVATPIADRASLHATIMDDGIMKMRPVKAIEVHPGEPAVLKPGGVHIMLMGLRQPLKEGATFPLTVSFEKAGPVEVQVLVRKAGSMEHGPDTEHQHQMMLTN